MCPVGRKLGIWSHILFDASVRPISLSTTTSHPIASDYCRMNIAGGVRALLLTFWASERAHLHRALTIPNGSSSRSVSAAFHFQIRRRCPLPHSSSPSQAPRPTYRCFRPQEPFDDSIRLFPANRVHVSDGATNPILDRSVLAAVFALRVMPSLT